MAKHPHYSNALLAWSGVDESRSLESQTDTNTREAREIPGYVAESPLANLPALRTLRPAMPPPPSAKPSVVSTDLPSGAGHPVNDVVHPWQGWPPQPD